MSPYATSSSPLPPDRAATASPFPALTHRMPARTSPFSQGLIAPCFSPAFSHNFLYRRVLHHEEP